jgi:hypothetical protein
MATIADQRELYTMLKNKGMVEKPSLIEHLFSQSPIGRSWYEVGSDLLHGACETVSTGLERY